MLLYWRYLQTILQHTKTFYINEVESTKKKKEELLLHKQPTKNLDSISLFYCMALITNKILDKKSANPKNFLIFFIPGSSIMTTSSL